MRSPPDNNEQPTSYSFGRTDGLHLAVNVVQYQRVEGVTVLERRRRKTTSGKVRKGEEDIDKASTVQYTSLRSFLWHAFDAFMSHVRRPIFMVVTSV